MGRALISNLGLIVWFVLAALPASSAMAGDATFSPLPSSSPYPWTFNTLATNQLVPGINPTLATQVINQSGPGIMPSRCAVTTVGTNKLAFLVPGDYRVDISNPQKVTVSSADLSLVFTLRISGPNPYDGSPLDPAAYRDTLLGEYRNARILAEFGAMAADAHGPGFDLVWRAAGKLDRFARVAYVTSPVGVLEFSLVCEPKMAGQAKTDLNFMMMTFRVSGPGGKLSLPVLSDRI